MLANRVREVTHTTGAGDLSLDGALSGHIGFADAFGPGDTISYVIEDGENYEIGEGTLTASGRLVRVTVLETLEAGTYTRDGALPISLSGNARVYCAATSQLLTSPVIRVDTITEQTDSAGVTLEQVHFSGGDVLAGGDLTLSKADARLKVGTLRGRLELGVNAWEDDGTRFVMDGARPISLRTGGVDALSIDLNQNLTLAGDVGIGVGINTETRVNALATSAENFSRVFRALKADSTLATSLTPRGLRSEGTELLFYVDGTSETHRFGSDGSADLSGALTAAGRLNANGARSDTPGEGLINLASDRFAFRVDDALDRYLHLDRYAAGVWQSAPLQSWDRQTGDTVINGNVSISEFLHHTDDTDTRLWFLENRLILEAGGNRFIDAQNGGLTLDTGGLGTTFGGTNKFALAMATFNTSLARNYVTIDQAEAGAGPGLYLRNSVDSSRGIIRFPNTGLNFLNAGEQNVLSLNGLSLAAEFAGPVNATGGLISVSSDDQNNGATLQLINSFVGSGWNAGDVIGDLDFRINDASASEFVRGRIRVVEDTAANSTYPSQNAMEFYAGSVNSLVKRLTLGSDGTATFEGIIRQAGTSPNFQCIKFDGVNYDNVIFYRNTDSNNDLLLGRDSQNVFIRTNGTTAVSFDSSQNSLFGGDIRVAGGGGTIGLAGTPNFANAYFIVGTPSAGIGIDSNEIASIGSPMFIGSTDDHDIQVWRNNVKKITVADQLIDLFSDLRVAGTIDSTETVTVTQDAGSFYTMDRTANANIVNLFTLGVATEGTIGTDYAWLGPTNNALRVYGDGAVASMGNLGVGVTPSALFHIGGASGTATALIQRTNAHSAGFTIGALEWQDSDGETRSVIRSRVNATDADATELAFIVTGASLAQVSPFVLRHDSISFSPNGPERWRMQGIDLIGIDGRVIRRNSNDGQLFISGGDGTQSGGNVVFSGGSTAGGAGDILFRSDGTHILRWDNSADEWNFQDKRTAGITELLRGIATDELTLSGGTANNTGGNVVLFGESHPTQASDILFRTGTTNRLFYNASADVWQVGSASLTRSVDNGSMWIGGGNDVTSGASLRLFGQSHAGNAYDIIMQIGADVAYQYDHSALSHSWSTDSLVRMQLGSSSLGLFVDLGLNGRSISGVGSLTVSNAINAASLPTFADDAAAEAGGVPAGTFYKTATGELRVKL